MCGNDKNDIIFEKGEKIMTKRATMAAKTIGAVMAIGGTAALISSSMGASSSKKMMKKKTAKAIKNITDIVNSIQSVM